MVEYLEPNEPLIHYIARNMRKADADEVWASDRATPFDALLQGWKDSYRSVIVAVDGEPCVMIGLVKRSLVTGVGIPWMLGTEGAIKYKKRFVSEVPAIIDEMLYHCPTLYNYVHCENKVSIRWLKRIGFKFDDPEPYGKGGELFQRFYLERQ